jgi:hypothetical protein
MVLNDMTMILKILNNNILKMCFSFYDNRHFFFKETKNKEIREILISGHNPSILASTLAHKYYGSYHRL